MNNNMFQHLSNQEQLYRNQQRHFINNNLSQEGKSSNQRQYSTNHYGRKLKNYQNHQYEDPYQQQLQTKLQPSMITDQLYLQLKNFKLYQNQIKESTNQNQIKPEQNKSQHHNSYNDSQKQQQDLQKQLDKNLFNNNRILKEPSYDNFEQKKNEIEQMNHDKINLKSYQHQKEQQNNKQQVDQNSQNINQNREIIKKTDKDTKNQNEKIRQLFNDNNFDFFEYNKGENFLILYENIVFYCLFVINNSSNQFQIKGKLYSVDFDQNKNPTFKIQEGIFNIDLQKKKFQLIGEGIEYLGKSKIIKFQGQFKNGQIFEIQPSSKQGLRAQSQEPIRKIIIKEGGKIINNNLKFQIKQFQPIKLWCKYNQQINERDIQILNNRRWLTSSVIDSFVLYLNLLSEKQYFKKNQNERQQISRILFLPTSLTTNFGSYYNDEKAKKLFNDELLQFQDINFELKIIYKRIGFPINKHNTHWQFLLFDYEKNQVELFDSLSFQIDQNLIQTLSRLLNLENCKQTKNEFSGQQNNGYACGYHVCSFMQHSYDLQFQKNAYYNYNESEIIQRLQKVIKDENEQ